MSIDSTFDPTVDPAEEGPVTPTSPSLEQQRTLEVRELPVEDFEPYRSTFNLHDFIEKRWRNERDIRIIWTGRNAGVGLGKTSGAISVAKAHYPAFDAENHAAMDAKTAIHLLRTAPFQSAPILDEVGVIADNRRSNSTANVELTQLFQMCRYRQYLLQATLPSISALDVRLIEMSDLRIHVTDQGEAKVYRYDQPDSATQRQLQPKILQYLEWDPIDNDPDYQYLSDLKDDRYDGLEESNLLWRDEHEQIVEREVEDAEKSVKHEILKGVYENTELTQSDIGEAIDLSGSRVGQIIRDE
ncbi:hypothetical protein AB7C87_01750 [Natrarchaeobius sp. A-rgal3]|uniref:hypothetical protein n=1 Tax=Natrarchaeobius versutus TaxID=1679078 RepID=UPI00350F1E18